MRIVDAIIETDKFVFFLNMLKAVFIVFKNSQLTGKREYLSRSLILIDICKLDIFILLRFQHILTEI